MRLPPSPSTPPHYTPPHYTTRELAPTPKPTPSTLNTHHFKQTRRRTPNRRLLLEGTDVSDSVAAPRLHDQLLPLPTITYFENGTWAPTRALSKGVLDVLESRGQEMEGQNTVLGVSQAIKVAYGSQTGGGAGQTGRGVLIGMSDARKDGAPFASARRCL